MGINQFDWVEFYKEFAFDLLEYKNNRAEIINKIKKIYEDININLPTLEKDNNIVDIDPFTVFGLFNKGITIENRIKILHGIANEFGVKADLPTSFDSIPILNNQNATFYHFIGERAEDDIDTLWLYFENALVYSIDQTEENRLNFSKVFDKVRNIKGIANSKLTMGIYWIAPDEYLNLDKRNTWYIYDSGKFPKEFVDSLPKIKGVLEADVYFEILDKVKKYIASDESYFNDFNELSYEAWRYSEEVNEEIKVNKLDSKKESKSAFIKWFEPIIEALKTLGGSAKPKDVKTQIIDDLNLGNDVLNEVRGKSKVNKFDNEVAWARAYLVAEGILLNNQHGVWALSEKGYNAKITAEYASGICKNWRGGYEKNDDEVDSKNIILEKDKPKAYTKDDFIKEVFIDEGSYDNLVNLLEYKKNIILQGAPGVGKTFAAKLLAYSMMGEKDNDRIKFIQFHQSYSYEDFIMGYRPVENGFELKNGVFYEFCKMAENDADNKFFFIIDEINRGNLSKIFGELFVLIEKDNRGGYLELVYSDESFTVPENLYIIGMMNTADRSLAMIDYALRRRFAFYDFEPAFSSGGFKRLQEKIDNRKFDNLIGCVESLNKDIEDDETLGAGFRIGHSYFCINSVEIELDIILHNIVEYEIIPLLKEYWFDELEKVNEWSTKLRGAVK